MDYILILKNKMEQDDYLFPHELSKFDTFMKDKKPLARGLESFQDNSIKHASNFLEYQIPDAVRRARNCDIFVKTQRIFNYFSE